MTPEKVEQGKNWLQRIRTLEAALVAVNGRPKTAERFLARDCEPMPFDDIWKDFGAWIPLDMQSRWRAELSAHLEADLSGARFEFEAL